MAGIYPGGSRMFFQWVSWRKTISGLKRFKCVRIFFHLMGVLRPATFQERNRTEEGDTNSAVEVCVDMEVGEMCERKVNLVYMMDPHRPSERLEVQ